MSKKGTPKKRGPKGPSKYTVKYIEQLADKMLKYIENTNVPMIKDFAWSVRIPSEEVSRTCANNEKFSHVLKMLKDKQERDLVNGGLNGKLNPTIVIFTLKNVAGWRDKQEHKHTGDISLTQLIENVDQATNKTSNRMAQFTN